MHHRRNRRAGAAGQATVEHIAIVVVVALLVAAVGAWLTSHVHPDRDSPPPTTHVWSGLDRIPEPAPSPPDLGLTPHDRGERTSGNALRRILRGVVKAHRLIASGDRAFATGFGHGLWVSVTDFARDPAALLTDGQGLVKDFAKDPVGLVTAQIDAAVDYARQLKAMSPHNGYLRVMHDLGEVSADAVIEGGRGFAKRKLLSALKRRLEERGVLTPAPGAPDKRDTN
jgi:hypothetical protein